MILPIRGEYMHYYDRGMLSKEAVTIIPLSDLHVGHPQARLNKLKEVLEHIRTTPNCYTVLIGDLAETATKSSKGDAYTTWSPQKELEWLIDEFKPIKDKILGVVPGNHEWRIWREDGTDIVKLFSLALGLPNGCYAQDSLIVRVNVGERPNGKPIPYLLYLHHGAGGGKTTGKWQRARELHGLIENADVYCSGHVHDPAAFPSVRRWVDTRHGKLIEGVYWNVVNSSWIPDAEYGERFGLPPGLTHTWEITLDGHKRAIKISGETY